MNVFELFAKISLDSSEYDKQLDQAKNSAENSGSKIGNAFKTAGKVAGTMLTVSTGAVTAFGKSSVEAGAEFDSSMSQVAATMGKSMEEFNSITASTTIGTKEFTGTLRDFAQYMGSTTAFSATEAADALNYMALAGYDAKTSMDMLPTVLNLAAAGNIDLAAASDMVTDAQTALGLNLDQTSAMVDQMAKAASKSNTSVEQLGDAFLTIGANAKNLSGGTIELSQVLGVLADNGIKGSEAGTHLRNIMLAMNPTTDKAANAWEELGVSAYDAQGNLRPLQDTFADLNEAMADMSDQQRSDTLTAMFNKTDLAAIGALLETDTKRYNELRVAIGNSAGAADKMAATQLDNLAGDITLFQSALEGAKIAISDGVTPVLRDLVQFGSEGLSRLTEAFKEDGFSGLMEELGNILSEGLNMLMETLPQVVDAGIGLLEAFGQGILDNLPMLIAVGMQIMSSIGSSILQNLPVIFSAAMQIILQLAQGLAQALPDLVPAIVDVMIMIQDTILNNLDLIIGLALEIIVALAEGLIIALPKLMDQVPVIISRLIEAFIALIPKIIALALQLIIALANGLIQAIPRLLLAVPQLIAALVGGFTNGIKDFIEVGKQIVSGLWTGIKDSWGRLKENASGLMGGLVGGFKKTLGISSPSKVFAQMGDYCVQGFEKGLEGLDDVKQLSELDASVNSISKSAMTSANVSGSSVSGSNETNNNVTVVLEGDAGKLFRMLRVENNEFMKANGKSAFA